MFLGDLYNKKLNESLRDGEYYVYEVTFDDGTTTKIKTSNDWFDAKAYYAKRGKNVIKAERVGGIQGGDYVAPRRATGGDDQERQDRAMQAMRRYDRREEPMSENRDDMIGFVLETERAYQAVIDRFGHVIDHDEESGIMYVPQKFWGRVQEVAYDADGIGAEESNGYENPEHYGLDEADKLQGTPVVSLSDFGDKDTKKDRYGRTVPKKLKKDDPRVKFYKEPKKQGVAEAGPFSYGKKPRKGSLKHQMAQQSKKYWDQQPVIEPKDQMVGTARVVKNVKEANPNQQIALYNPDGKTYRHEKMPGYDKDDIFQRKQQIELDSEHGVSPWDDRANTQDPIEQQSLAKTLNKYIDQLPPRMKQILVLRFWKGKTLEEIAQQFNMTMAGIKQIEAKALRMLKAKAKEDALGQYLPARHTKYDNWNFEESKKDPGVSKDQETKFHSKLDTLVHNTFGKRKVEMDEGQTAFEIQFADGKKDTMYATSDHHDPRSEPSPTEMLSMAQRAHPGQKIKSIKKTGKAVLKATNEDIERYVDDLERAGYGIKEEKQRLDPKCWKGYRKAGTKMKGGVRVNNCVPIKKKK